jgi:hypothetical protein
VSAHQLQHAQQQHRHELKLQVRVWFYSRVQQHQPSCCDQQVAALLLLSLRLLLVTLQKQCQQAQLWQHHVKHQAQRHCSPGEHLVMPEALPQKKMAYMQTAAHWPWLLPGCPEQLRRFLVCLHVLLHPTMLLHRQLP